MNLYCILVCLCDMNCSVMGDWYCMLRWLCMGLTKVLGLSYQNSRIPAGTLLLQYPTPKWRYHGCEAVYIQQALLCSTENTKGYWGKHVLNPRIKVYLLGQAQWVFHCVLCKQMSRLWCCIIWAMLEIDFMSIKNTHNNTPPQSLIGVRNFNQMNPSSDFKESRETYPSSLPPFKDTV